MAPRADFRGPGVRLALAAGVLLALLAVVALASGGGLGGGGGTPAASDALLDRLFTVLLVLLVLYVPVAIWVYWSARDMLREQLIQAGARRRSPLMILIVVGVWLLAALAFVRLRDRLGLHRVGDAARAFPPAAGATGGAPAAKETPALDWPTALAVLAVAAAVFAAYLGFDGRRRRSRISEPSVAELLALALAESLEDILTERDPRRAVIAAYARMERVLGAAGVPRAPHEAPFEYVGRALLDLDVGEPSVRRLTLLYERARFSTHEIDETMRAEAIAALDAVQAELTAPAEAA
jgi:uncharacterized protein DUF4129